MNAKFHYTKSFSGLLLLVSLLPACWWSGQKTDSSGGAPEAVKDAGDVKALAKEAKQVADTMMEEMLEPTHGATHYGPMTGDVIVTMKGKPLITTGMVEAKKEQIKKANPQEFQAMMAWMNPEGFDKLLAANLAQQAMIDQDIVDRKIDQTDQYKEELKEGYKTIKAMVNEKHWTQQFPVTVSDAQVKEFYEKNKEIMPALLLAPGGITAMGIQFDTEQAAQAFMTTVKQNNDDFKKAAQAAGLSDKVRDFRLVHARSMGIDPLLRDKIIEIKKAPSTELFTINGVPWVVHALSKDEAKYRPLEQVKDNIQKELEKQKRNEKVAQGLEDLKKKYDVVLNQDYFKAGETPEVDEEALMEMLESAQE